MLREPQHDTHAPAAHRGCNYFAPVSHCPALQQKFFAFCLFSKALKSASQFAICPAARKATIVLPDFTRSCSAESHAVL